MSTPEPIDAAPPASEFSRMVEIGRLGDGQRHLVASPEECAALARRFDLVAIHRLEATLELTADGPVIMAEGRMQAAITQSCAISGEDMPVAIDEPLSLRFVPEQTHRPDEEVELDEADCDEIAYAGTRFDLGEAVAQSVALAIDPFACGPAADAARKEAGLLSEEATGPFAALAALKPRDS